MTGIKHPTQKGFTLVELAIVITIIGLLIGGVLKGQELLQNARMTSAAASFKSISAATLTFKDVYKALPGDITNPANFISNCTTAPCNISGSGDGHIGGNLVADAYVDNDENANYWLHMAKANLLAGVDPNLTWTSATWFVPVFYRFPLGGKLLAHEWVIVNNGWYPGDAVGLYYRVDSDNLDTRAVPINVIAKFDLKIDDGKPWTGDLIMANGPCGVVLGYGATVYDPNNTTPCNFWYRAL